MKDRILNGWNGRRVFYLLAGLGLMVISFKDAQWAGVLVGGYFTSMGLFAFGCAGGNCFGGTCESKPEQNVMDKLN